MNLRYTAIVIAGIVLGLLMTFALIVAPPVVAGRGQYSTTQVSFDPHMRAGWRSSMTFGQEWVDIDFDAVQLRGLDSVNIGIISTPSGTRLPRELLETGNRAKYPEAGSNREVPQWARDHFLPIPASENRTESECVVIGHGWPYVAASHRRAFIAHHTPVYYNWIGLFGERGGLVFVPPLQAVGIPTRPYWPGLIANWAIFSGLFIATALSCSAVRRQIRRQRRRCVECGYDLRGSACGSCSECGAKHC